MHWKYKHSKVESIVKNVLLCCIKIIVERLNFFQLLGVTLLGDVSDDIYLLMEDCWGTVSDDPDSLPKYPLIGDG